MLVTYVWMVMAAHALAECPPRFVGLDNRCYSFVLAGGHGRAAMQGCIALNAYLYRAEEKEERDIVDAYIAAHFPRLAVWRIGGYFVKAQSAWFWSPNRQISNDNWVNNTVDRDTLVMTKTAAGYKWRGERWGSVYQPSLAFPYICEAEAMSTQSAEATDAPGGSNGQRYGQRSYSSLHRPPNPEVNSTDTLNLTSDPQGPVPIPLRITGLESGKPAPSTTRAQAGTSGLKVTTTPQPDAPGTSTSGRPSPSQECVDGKFGLNCASTCHCNDACDKVTGECLSGCLPGWRASNCQQQDCSHELYCGIHKCQESDQDYNCSCLDGYENSRPKLCQDIDECDQGEICDIHTCVNTNGSFECVCKNESYINVDRQICLNTMYAEISQQQDPLFLVQDIEVIVVQSTLVIEVIIFMCVSMILCTRTVARAIHKHLTTEPYIREGYYCPMNSRLLSVDESEFITDGSTTTPAIHNIDGSVTSVYSRGSFKSCTECESFTGWHKLLVDKLSFRRSADTIP